jgi:tripartite-type tricarboxylate transporter receptor subunit TctC
MNAQSNQQHPTQPSPIKAMRRSWHIAALLLAVASLLSQPVWSQSRTPVRLLSGFPPGGNIDVLARLLAEPMSEALERPVVVENRPGAGGQIAAELLKSAPADGSVLMLCPDAILVIRPYTLATAPYNPVSDFTAIAHTGTWAMAVGVAANVPAKNLAEFASWAKGRAGGGSGASYGSAGEGGSTHLLGALLTQAMGADMTHVPYKGAGPAVSDVVAGHISATLQPLGTLLTQARAGKLRIIAISSNARSPAAPEVPTFNESGYGALSFEGWFGVFGPAGMNAALTNRLHDVLAQILRRPAMQERMRGLDLIPREMSVNEFNTLVKADAERWEKAIRGLRFRAAN